MLLVAAVANAQPTAWEYADHLRDRLLYLHPLVNYGLHSAWQRTWQDRLFSQSSVRSSFGSVTLAELLCDSRVTINERLGNGLWFRLDDRWCASHHIDVEQKSTFIGLEEYVWKGFSVFCQGDLAFEKEHADILFGVSVTDSTRRRYGRVAFLDEDQFYDEKNALQGITTRRPLGVTWALNLAWGPLAIFSEGQCSSGFRRSYPDTGGSPELRSHIQRTNEGLLALYWDVARGCFVELSGSDYEFKESKSFSDADTDYAYSNRVSLCRLGCLLTARERIGIRAGSCYVRQEARSTTNSVFAFRRHEFLPYAFLEFERRFGMVELGYMGAAYDWRHETPRAEGNCARSGYVDKIKLAYSYAFGTHAKIQLSISHVLAIEEFGGGNVQFLMFF